MRSTLFHLQDWQKRALIMSFFFFFPVISTSLPEWLEEKFRLERLLSWTVYSKEVYKVRLFMKGHHPDITKISLNESKYWSHVFFPFFQHTDSIITLLLNTWYALYPRGIHSGIWSISTGQAFWRAQFQQVPFISIPAVSYPKALSQSRSGWSLQLRRQSLVVGRPGS